MRKTNRRRGRTLVARLIVCHGAVLATAIGAGAGIAKGDPIQFIEGAATASENQNTSTLDVNAAVNGTSSQTSSGWAPGNGAAKDSSASLGGEGAGGYIAVFPVSTTDSGAFGTNLTFDLYLQYSSQNERIGGFEIEVTTDPSTPSVSSGASPTVTGSFSPVSIESVASSSGKTTFTIDPNPTTAANDGDYVIAQNNGTEPANNGSAADIYEITAFSTLTGITGVELIAFYTTANGSGTGGLTAGTGDGEGLDQNNFVLNQITGTATPAPEPTALGFASLGGLLFLRRRRRGSVGNRLENGSGNAERNPSSPGAP